MKNKLFLEVHQKWEAIGRYKKPDKLDLELELYKKLLNIFQVGDFYYFVFVPSLGLIEHASDSVAQVLGHNPSELTTDLFLESVHPEDFPYFAAFEDAVVNFKMNLPPDKIMKYKSRYNYRIKKRDGAYMHIVQQSVTIQCDEDGAVLRNLVVHTDISAFKKDNKMTLSFIGLEGEPSYIDVQPLRKFSPSKEPFTVREMEILNLLAQNMQTDKIAEVLFISPNTVSTHRKNMFSKVGVHTALELVTLSLKKGWL